MSFSCRLHMFCTKHGYASCHIGCIGGDAWEAGSHHTRPWDILASSRVQLGNNAYLSSRSIVDFSSQNVVGGEDNVYFKTHQSVLLRLRLARRRQNPRVTLLLNTLVTSNRFSRRKWLSRHYAPCSRSRAIRCSSSRPLESVRIPS